MDLNYKIESVEIPELHKIMLQKQRDGYRLTQICATAFEGYNELIYSVSKGYEFENYKIVLPIDESISTMSDFFPSAMLYENEMKELFGVKVESTNPDFQNKFFRIKKETPFKKEVKDAIKIVKPAPEKPQADAADKADKAETKTEADKETKIEAADKKSDDRQEVQE